MSEAPVQEVAAMSITPKEPEANGNAPKAVEPSSSPAPNAETSTATFKDQFKAFSKFGDVKSDGKFITLSQSDKWMKQAHVRLSIYYLSTLYDLKYFSSQVIDKKITTTDTGIHFKKLKAMKVPITDYQKFLEDLAKTRGMDLADIKSKMTNCGAPGLVSVKVS